MNVNAPPLPTPKTWPITWIQLTVFSVLRLPASSPPATGPSWDPAPAPTASPLAPCEEVVGSHGTSGWHGMTYQALEGLTSQIPWLRSPSPNFEASTSEFLWLRWWERPHRPGLAFSGGWGEAPRGGLQVWVRCSRDYDILYNITNQNII